MTVAAPAAFIGSVNGHGASVTIDASNTTATWSAKGCNQIAVLDPKSTNVANPSYTITINASDLSGKLFVDIGWCSPNLDPSGKNWPVGPPGPAEANWMGEQGIEMDWIYRSSGEFKASTEGAGGNAPTGQKWCLPPDDTFNRGEVRPWGAATVSACDDSASGNAGSAGVHWDVELGTLYSDVNTVAQLCFGVC
jgi:hypothetical protein